MTNPPVSEEKRTEVQSASGDVENAPATQVKNEDRDIAIDLVGESRQEIDPVVEARVVRKIDFFLVPAMIVGYGLVYYDKASRRI